MRIHRPSILGFAIVCLLSVLWCGAVSAQADGPSAKLSADFLKAKIDEVEASSELPEETRAKLIESYRRAITQLQAVEAQRALAENFRRAATTAPGAAAKVRRDLEQRVAREVGLGLAANAATGEVEAALLKERANRAALDAKLADLESQLATEVDRPDVIRTRLAEARQAQAEAASELERATGTSAEEAARRWLLEARRAALAAEIQALDDELLSQPARLELLSAERDMAALGAERSRERVRALEEILLEQRRAESEQATAEAEAVVREHEGKHPAVRDLAERNAALTAEIAEITKRLERAAGAVDEVVETKSRVEEDFRSAKRKLEVAGLSQALGMVLQEQRRALPDITSARKQVASRENEIAAAALRQIQYREERRTLRSLSRYVEERVDALPEEQAAEIDATIESELKQLASTRRKLLDQAADMDRAYLRALGDLDFAQRGLIETVTEYDQFLSGRLLWIRTAPPLTLGDLLAIPSEAAAILAPSRWAGVGEVLWDQAVGSPSFVAGLVLFVALLWSRGRLKRALEATGTNVGRPTSDGIGATLQALALTAVLALAWPLLIGSISWQLASAPQATEFTRAVANGLAWIARTLVVLEFFRCMCLDGGLADRHFGWAATLRRAIRQQLGRLMAGFLGFGFVVALLANAKHVPFTGGLGRLALIGALAAVGVFAYGMLHPKTGALRNHLASESGGVASHLRGLWAPLAILVLIVLGGLTVAGYFYAAGALVFRSVLTISLAFGIALLHELAIRWLTLTHRRLAYRAAIERREAARLAREKSERAEGSAVEAVPVSEEDTIVDLDALGEESRKLLDFVLWATAAVGMVMVWWPVLPALDVLDEFTLWTTITKVAGEEQLVPVTVADVGLALLFVLLTIVATHRLPALLQFAVLERFDVSAGSQYAISSLLRYAVGAIGFALVTNMVGLDWSQVQWLVAALGVGIGFGLQEIVANFISGLIILFERPVRVGDVVTVGNTDGVVTKIRIRATTIRTWDRMELLVPNKEFVTGRLLNWSLSDPITRISVPVGVAYGSDVQRAMAVMMEIAAENPQVLAEPAPFVVFDGFGDNALSLRLRCYVGSLDVRLRTVSDLHEEINRRFEAAGIVIAFPQRDLHLKSATPLEVRVRHDDAKPAGASNEKGPES